MRRFVTLSAVAASLWLSSALVEADAMAEPPALRLHDGPAVAAHASGALEPVTLTTSLTPGPFGAGIAAAKPKPTPPALVARINLSSQRMEVLAGGSQLHTWAISSGRSGYASPRGNYRVQWTSRMWYSRKYDNAPMPHAVFFTGGVAVHATSSVGMLGRPASHGCIRLAPGNAAQFYALVQKYGNKQTQIEVFGSAPSGAVASRTNRDHDEASVRSSRGERRVNSRGSSRRVASLESDGRPQSFVQNGIRYVRIR